MNHERRIQINKLSSKLVGVRNWLETFYFYAEAEARLAPHTQCAETGGVTSARDERDCAVLDNAVKSLEDIIDSLTAMTLRGGRHDARLVEQDASAAYREEPRQSNAVIDSLGGIQ
jgi:hypothetical protein